MKKAVHDNIVEICTASIGSAISAEKGGANRIELVDNLLEGGTTPGLGMIKTAKELLELDIMVMIRPRGGDFLYSDEEFRIMKQDIMICRDIGVKGVVFGILLPDGNVDLKRIKELVKIAGPLDTTFHRAFDLTRDPFFSIEQIIDCGVHRILTSGQKNTVAEGVELIKELIEIYGNKITIMPGSGINEQNIKMIRDKTKAKEFHMTARSLVDSKMVYRKPDIFMGGFPQIPEYKIFVTDAERVKKIITLVNES